jgi:O-antigen/teichoic acid export membrane protein
VGAPAASADGRRRSLAGGALISLISQAAVLGTAAVTSIALARLIGPSDLGTWAVAANLVGAGVVILAFGLPAGVTYVMSSGSWTAPRARRETLVAAAALGLVAVLVVGAAWALFHDSALRGLSLLQAELAGLTLAGALAFNIWVVLLLASERYERYGLAQLVTAATTTVGPVAGAIPGGVTGALAGYVIGQAVGAAYCLAALPVRNPASAVRLRRWSGLWRAARFGRLTWGADFLQLINYRFDLFFLNALAGRAEVGRYSIAVALTAVGWMLPQALATVLFPRTARLSGEEEDETAQSTGEIAVRHTVALLPITALALVVLALAGVPLLYGSRYHATIGYSLLLIPGVVALGLAKVFSAIITGRGYPRYSLYNALITVPPTIALYLVLIPPLGATGAAISSTGSYLATTVLAAIFYRRVTGVRLTSVLVPGRGLWSDYRQAAVNLRRYFSDWRQVSRA